MVQYTYTLTGRARFRLGWFGRMVPQVEAKVETRHFRTPPPPHMTNAAQRKNGAKKRI